MSIVDGRVGGSLIHACAGAAGIRVDALRNVLVEQDKPQQGRLAPFDAERVPRPWWIAVGVRSGKPGRYLMDRDWLSHQWLSLKT